MKLQESSDQIPAPLVQSDHALVPIATLPKMANASIRHFRRAPTQRLMSGPRAISRMTLVLVTFSSPPRIKQSGMKITESHVLCNRLRIGACAYPVICRDMVSEINSRRLILGCFDDMILESGTSFGQQAVGQHLTWPFDREIGREHPNVGRSPSRPMFVR